MISKRPTEHSRTMDQVVGERLHAMLTRSGMPRSELAERLGLKLEIVDEFCAGTRRIGASLLIEISRLCGVKVSDFYADVTEPENRD